VGIDVGLIAPLPPQVGGVASLAGWLLAHERELGCRYVAFDLWRPPRDEAGGRLHLAAVGRQLRLLGQFIRWLLSSPSLIHYCAAYTWTGLVRDVVYLLLLRIARRTVIVHIQVVGDESSRVWRGVNRLLALLSVERVVIAPWSVSVLARMGVSSRCIFNPVRLSPNSRRGARDSEPPRLLFVGTYGRRKGCPELIDAVAQLRDGGIEVRLTLVGHEERRGEEAMLRAQIDNRHLVAEVEFVGVVSPLNLHRYYEGADIFCLPSRVEGLPMALLEAMSFGLPVVATPVGGIPDVVEDGESGVLVPPGDAEALAAAVRSLCLNRDAREHLSAAAHARVQTLAGPEKIVFAWKRLYSKYAGAT
jgi:glycosyltransferase involved in cell wall biosynthesis